MSFVVNPFNVAPVPATIVYTDVKHGGTNTTTFSHASTNIGTEAADRFAIVVAENVSGFANSNMLTCVINGVSASLLYEVIGNATTGCVSMWGANVPTGTSVTISGTHDLTSFDSLSVYAAYGLQSTTPINKYSDIAHTSNALEVSIDEPDQGFVLAAISWWTTTSTTVAWTGTASITEQVDSWSSSGHHASGATKNCSAAASGTTVIATFSQAATNSMGLACITMR